MKTIAEINEKIKKGKAVVVTAEELVELCRKKDVKKIAKEIDVVTTGTFGPMCSSGVFLNFGHSKPRIKFGGGKVYLNGVPAYAGLAAVDVYLGATALPDNDPRNRHYPGEFKYGGGHVIEELVSGKEIKLEGISYATDCYPRKELKTLINLEGISTLCCSELPASGRAPTCRVKLRSEKNALGGSLSSSDSTGIIAISPARWFSSLAMARMRLAIVDSDVGRRSYGSTSGGSSTKALCGPMKNRMSSSRL